MQGKPFSNLLKADIFLSIVIFLHGLLFVGVLISQNYFGLNSGSALSFVGNDGWCDTSKYGIGTHCFGDFAIMSLPDLAENPWDVNIGIPWNYPAGGMIFSLLFISMGQLFGSPQIGLLLFLVTSVSFLSISAYWASKGSDLLRKLIIILFLGIISIPALNILDRGNSLVLAVPAIFLLLIGVSRDKSLFQIAALIVLALVKPQFVILLVIPLFLGKWKIFGWSAFGVVLSNLSAYLIWPQNFPQTIKQSINNVLQYSNSSELDAVFPANVSFVRGLFLIEQFLNKIFGINAQNSIVMDYKNQIVLLIAATILIWLFFIRNQIPKQLLVIIVLALASLSVPVTWSYYLVFTIPVAAIMVRDPSIDPSSQKINGLLDDEDIWIKKAGLARWVFIVVLALSLSGSIIPWLGVTDEISTSAAPVFGVLWMVVIFLFLLTWSGKSKIRGNYSELN